MKVIFLENIENNQVGEVKNVPDGYARNFLIPRGIAAPATPGEIANVEKRIEKLKKDEEQKAAALKDTAQKLEKISIEVLAEAGPENEEGVRKLFGSVTNSQAEDALKEKGFEIDKKDIDFEPIKEPGEYEITVKLGHGVEAKVAMKVVVSESK